MNWWEEPLYALDLETTGQDPHACEIVSWALVKLAPTGHVLESHASVCQVTRWNAGAESIHGIPEAVSRAGVTQAAMRQALADLLAQVISEGAPLVVFNAGYDLTILARQSNELAEAVRILHVIDPLVIDRALDKYRKGPRRLGTLCVHFGVEHGQAHDALADATAAGRLALMLPLAYADARVPRSELHASQVAWSSEWASGYQAYKRRSDPSATIDGSWPVRREVVS